MAIFMNESSFIEYQIYFPYVIETSPSHQKKGEILTQLKNEIIEYLWKQEANTDFLKEYIWHNEEFTLEVLENKLIGRVTFGENLDDEWLIVYLLYLISKKFENCVICVRDNDGEFLLIEAANEIPTWITPENSKNRVWIYGGKLHIIPLPMNPGQIKLFPSNTISPTIGAQLVLDSVFKKININTEASPEVQFVIETKLSEIPLKANTSKHRIKCYLPIKIAHLLKHQPKLIAPAIRAFYERDLDGMKACQTMKQFNPTNSRVLVMTQFTKCLYAQLHNQKLVVPPAIFGSLPPSNHPNFKAYDMGIKLSCGFEILYNQLSLNQENKSEEEKLKQTIDHLLTLPYSEQDFSEQNLTKDDDESWMNVSINEIEELLGTQEKNSNSTTSNTDNQNIKDLNEIVTRMKTFLQDISSFEGIGEEENEEDISNEEDEEKEEEINFEENDVSSDFPNLTEGMDLDYNLMKNFLESYQSQSGESGPVSNIMSQMSSNSKKKKS